MTTWDFFLQAVSPTIQTYVTAAMGFAITAAYKLFKTWTDKIHNDKVRTFVEDHVWAIFQKGKDTMTGQQMHDFVLSAVQKNFPKFPTGLVEIFIEASVAALKVSIPDVPKPMAVVVESHDV